MTISLDNILIHPDKPKYIHGFLFKDVVFKKTDINCFHSLDFCGISVHGKI